MEAEHRRAARLILLDERGRVFLLEHTEPRGGLFWATPGGGLEPGESAEQAAHREAVEELGAAPETLERVWVLETEFPWGDRRIRQEDTYFLATLAGLLFGHDVSATHHREGICRSRWWSVDEIRSSTERVYPRDLATRLDELRAR